VGSLLHISKTCVKMGVYAKCVNNNGNGLLGLGVDDIYHPLTHFTPNSHYPKTTYMM